MKTQHCYRVLPSLRLVEMHPYAFGQLDEIKLERLEQGEKLIDLSLGSPDRETAPSVLEALNKGMTKRRNQQYPIFSGLPAFKSSIVKWMKHRFNVELDPKHNVLPLIGSKEGIGHIAFAYIQEGDITIIPSPYYPVHMRGTVLSGGNVYELPLKAENNFIADLDSIPEDILIRAKILVLSYPNNPTGAVVDKAYLEKAVQICKEYNIILLNDFAYSEIWFDENKPSSVLEIPGALDVAIEFHTFSKTYNMAGFRLGFAVGNQEIVQTLYKLKTNLDYGVCMGIQEAGIAALDLGDEYRERIRKEYEARRNIVMDYMRKYKLESKVPGGAMYVWFKIPENLYRKQGESCLHFASDLLRETGVALVPGLTFGSLADRYIRLALVQSQEDIKEAMEKLGEFLETKRLLEVH
jgi:LL-diaminopimelate aminotransferase